MECNTSNIISYVFKILGLVSGIALLGVNRWGADGYYLGFGVLNLYANGTGPLGILPDINIAYNINIFLFSVLVVYGFPLMAILSISSQLGGDKSKVHNTLFGLIACLFYLVYGALQVYDIEDHKVGYPYEKELWVCAGMGFITSGFYLIETIFNFIKLCKK